MEEDRWDTPTIVVQQPQTVGVPRPTQSKTGTILVLVIFVGVVVYYFCFANNK